MTLVPICSTAACRLLTMPIDIMIKHWSRSRSLSPSRSPMSLPWMQNVRKNGIHNLSRQWRPGKNNNTAECQISLYFVCRYYVKVNEIKTRVCLQYTARLENCITVCLAWERRVTSIQAKKSVDSLRQNNWKICRPSVDITCESPPSYRLHWPIKPIRTDRDFDLLSRALN